VFAWWRNPPSCWLKKILEQFDHQFCGIQFVSAKTIAILWSMETVWSCSHVPQRTSRGLKRACCISARSAASSALWRVAAEAYQGKRHLIISTCSLRMANNSMNINLNHYKIKLYEMYKQSPATKLKFPCFLLTSWGTADQPLCRSRIPIRSQPCGCVYPPNGSNMETP